MHNLLKTTEDDWIQAEQYFRQNPDQSKMRRKDHSCKYSFIKVGDDIYAMANEYLGQGNQGKLKVGQDRNGKNYAIKIEADKNDLELQVMQLIKNYFKGQVVRKFGERKTWRKDRSWVTDVKSYMVMELLEGIELKILLMNAALTETQNLLVALKSCQSIFTLHQLRIIHADICTANFVVSIKGNHVISSACDYGLSKILPQNEDVVRGYGCGHLGYIAPEAAVFESEFSFKSDVYALGCLIKDLGISIEIYGSMIEKKPQARPELKVVIEQLAAKLEKQADVDDDVREAISVAKNYSLLFSKQNIKIVQEQQTQSMDLKN